MLMASKQEPLSVTHPELASQAVDWDPHGVTAGLNLKVLWKCEFGHSWEARISSRAIGHGCPYCSGRQITPGFNDLATTHPEIAAEADGWDPRGITSGSSKKLSFKCEFGHSWEARISSRAIGKSGCPFCSGRQITPGFNDLATTHPEIAAEADGWDPHGVKSTDITKRAWKCELGHSWKTSCRARRFDESGCPFCSGNQVLAGFNDLATTNPELAAEADGWDPKMISKGSDKVVAWLCPLGHQFNARISHRTLLQSGCPFCSNKKVLVGFNDLATTNPELAAEADGWDPKTLTEGSTKNVDWKCGLGHQWKSRLRNRSLGIGCPSCALTGFDPNQAGWLYLIDNDSLEMFQIGISNFPDKRLKDHSKRGWEAMEVRGPMEGHLAQQLETAILHAVERRGAVLGHKAQIEKFDGYSEAWTKDSLTVTSFKQLLDWVYEDDQ